MKLIAENLHIISAKTKKAVLENDEEYLAALIKRMSDKNPDWIDLNIGPARGNFSGTMKRLTSIVNRISDIPISFDSTNFSEIEDGFELSKIPEKCIINSTNADEDRLEKAVALAKKYNANLIALTMNSETGIPKEADGRLELAIAIQSYAEASGMQNEKIFFDPLVLPICVDQSQASECLNTIRMLKESFEPAVCTTIGLSNVSNGCPPELRPLINRVFLVMARGCGLDSAIVDIFDDELLRVAALLDTQAPQNPVDEVYLALYEVMKNFEELENIKCCDESQTAVYKTAEILLNQKVYSNSYLSV